MKILIMLCSLVLLNTSFVRASEIVPIEELASGACLFHENNGRNLVKLASFNDSLAWLITKDKFAEYKKTVQTFLLKKENLNFLDQDFEVFVHCGSKAQLIFNIDMKGFHLCVWNELTFEGIIPDYDIGVTHYDGPCDGFIPGRVVIYAATLSSTQVIEKALLADSWKKMISYHTQGNAYGKITVFLTEEYKFSMEKFIDALYDEFDKDVLNYAEPESLYHHLGEFKKLQNFSTR